MRLSKLLENVEYQIIDKFIDHEISGIAYDSRQVKPGYLFVCIKGFKTDGHLFAEQAVVQGAVAVLGEEPLSLAGEVVSLLAADTRSALAGLAANFYGHPDKKMRLIGVTGTNGKTTTTHLIEAVLEEAGKKTGLIGTLYARIGDINKNLGHTTPESLEIEKFLDECWQIGAEYVVMEVSSHALALKRVHGLDFNCAVFTNLTQDHLDLHKDMDDYLNVKLQLFAGMESKSDNFSIINYDDECAADFIQAAKSRVCIYGVKEGAQVKAEEIKIGLHNSSFSVCYGQEKFTVSIQLIGLFSVYNALAAIAFALQEGIEIPVIISALEKVAGIPGRFEQIDCGQDFTVVVDYAHTPDGLENILKTGRKIAQKRLITVFGCGGDRDRSKRPLMGAIAAKYSDFTIVTSDNPRSEEPTAIIDDILPGLEKEPNARFAIIIDRREAIHHAMNLARSNDLVIIAGKGHETYQLVKDQVLDFDDRQVAAGFLQGRVLSEN